MKLTSVRRVNKTEKRGLDSLAEKKPVVKVIRIRVYMPVVRILFLFTWVITLFLFLFLAFVLLGLKLHSSMCYFQKNQGI